MNERDLFDDAPVTPEESEQARRFAESLESGDPGGADPGALSVANLLRGLSADEPAGEGEAEEAEALAEALQSGHSERADRRSLSVAYFLESLSPGVTEDRFAATRLRGELVGSASRRTRRRVVQRWAAAAALVLAILGGSWLWRPGRVPDEDLLARREAAALEAVASISGAAWDPGAERRTSQLESLRRQRFSETVQVQRMSSLVSGGDASDSGGAGGGGCAPRGALVPSGGAS